MAKVLVQKKILKTLRLASSEITVEQLITEVRQDCPAKTIEVRAALLPLLSARRIELTASRKLRLVCA